MVLTSKDILFVLCITRNLMSMPKFSKDNQVVFKFLTDKCRVKSRVSKLVLLEVFLNGRGLYCFPELLIDPSRFLLNYENHSKPTNIHKPINC